MTALTLVVLTALGVAARLTYLRRDLWRPLDATAPLPASPAVTARLAEAREYCEREGLAPCWPTYGKGSYEAKRAAALEAQRAAVAEITTYRERVVARAIARNERARREVGL